MAWGARNLISTQASHGPTTYEAYLATRRAPSKDDLEPPTCRESCCPCLPKARPPPEEKDGATPLKRPSKSLDDDEGEKKDP